MALGAIAFGNPEVCAAAVAVLVCDADCVVVPAVTREVGNQLFVAAVVSTAVGVDDTVTAAGVTLVVVDSIGGCCSEANDVTAVGCTDGVLVKVDFGTTEGSTTDVGVVDETADG